MLLNSLIQYLTKRRLVTMSYHLILLIGLAAVVRGQGPRTGDNHAGQPEPGKGKLTLSTHQSEEAPTLETLIRLSSLIIDGAVISSLPPVLRNPNQPASIQTYSVIAVDRVLFGSVALGAVKILLVQPGGTLGGREVTVPSDPLVKPGDRYIMFLRPDTRALPIDATEYPRYIAAGGSAGKARVENSLVSFLPEADARLHAHDNTPVDIFLKTLVDKTQGKAVVAPRSGVPFPGAGAVAGAGTLRKP
jgi:hypothetical protein